VPVLHTFKNFKKTEDLVFCFVFYYVTDGNIMHLTDASRFLISCVIQHYAPVMGWGRWRNRCIMLIMTLDLSWRQTLRLPPPGIEPRSPASPGPKWHSLRSCHLSSGGQRYSKMYRLKRYRYTIFKKKIA
jgi:hypothetical protein